MLAQNSGLEASLSMDNRSPMKMRELPQLKESLRSSTLLKNHSTIDPQDNSQTSLYQKINSNANRYGNHTRNASYSKPNGNTTLIDYSAFQELNASHHPILSEQERYLKRLRNSIERQS